MADDPLSDDNASVRRPALSEVNERQTRAIMAGVRSWIPARVETYDAARQMVSVQVLVRDFHRDESGALVATLPPVINNLPVEFASVDGMAITLPVRVGTLGSIAYAERSLDRWLTGDGSAVDPGLYSRFNLTDAKFIPGLRPFGTPLAYAPTDRLKIGQDDANGAFLEILDDGSVRVHDSAGGTITLANGAITASAASGQGVTVNAGAGANVAINAGAAGSVVVNGGIRPVAANNDLAGIYPIVATGLFFKTT